MKEKILISLAVFFFVSVSMVSAANYYVSASGWVLDWQSAKNRSTPGSALQARSNAVAGDTIIFINDAGWFTENIVIDTPVNSGTPGNPITFKGEDGTDVVINAGSFGVRLTGKNHSYINIENFIFENQSGIAIDLRSNSDVYSNSHISITNNIFNTGKRWQWGVVRIEGNNNYITIRNNTFRGGYGAHNDGNLSGTWNFPGSDGNLSGTWNFTASSSIILGAGGNAQNELNNGDYIKISGSGTWFKVDGEPSGPNSIAITPAYPSWLNDYNKIVSYWNSSNHSEASPYTISGTGGNVQSELRDGDWIRIDGAPIPRWYEVNGTPPGANSILIASGFLEGSASNKTLNYFNTALHPYDEYHYELLWFAAGTGRSIHHCLVEDNIVTYGASHDPFEFQTNGGTVEYNIVRNNVIHNPMHGVLNLYGSSGTSSDRNLVENNIIYEGGEGCSLNSCYENLWGSSNDMSAQRWSHNGLQIYGDNNIIRRNIIYSNGLGNNIELGSENNRIYNNVLYSNARGWLLNVGSYSVNGNVYKNNILKDNNKPGGGTYANYPLYVSLDTSPCTNEWAYNNFDDVNNIRYSDCNYAYGVKTLAYLETNIPAIFHSNLKNESGFADVSGHDFHLSNDSPMIDAGGFLTTTKGSASSSNTINVEDASYFTDGWGLIEGDLIQLEGQSDQARITNVNYSTNTITIDQSISWNDNQGISLAYKGSAPDMGAYEYTSQECIHKSDSNCNGCVSDTELTAFIDQWKADSSDPTLKELIEAIGLWKRGCS